MTSVISGAVLLLLFSVITDIISSAVLLVFYFFQVITSMITALEGVRNMCTISTWTFAPTAINNLHYLTESFDSCLVSTGLS
jgi:hypothetical protein